MSKTKVMTMQDLKDNDKKVILTHNEYILVLNKISELQDIVEKNTDEGNIQEAENILLKSETKNLVSLVKNYKSQLENKDNKEKANEIYLKELDNNRLRVNEELSKRKQSKYSKMSKEEIERISMERFNLFKDEYKNDL